MKCLRLEVSVHRFWNAAIEAKRPIIRFDRKSPALMDEWCPHETCGRSPRELPIPLPARPVGQAKARAPFPPARHRLCNSLVESVVRCGLESPFGRQAQGPPVRGNKIEIVCQ